MEFSGLVQQVADSEGREITREMIWSCFTEHYLEQGNPYTLLQPVLATDETRTYLDAQLAIDGEHLALAGEGNGPLAALVDALAQQGLAFDIADYHEHAVRDGAQSEAIAYIEIRVNNQLLFGVGRDGSVLQASLMAVVSAVCRATRLGLLKSLSVTATA
jgi:2-isopropylmalate synthase